MTTNEPAIEATTATKPRKRWRAWVLFLLLLAVSYIVAQEYMAEQYRQELQAIKTSEAETAPSTETVSTNADTTHVDAKPDASLQAPAQEEEHPATAAGSTEEKLAAQEARIQALEEKLATVTHADPAEQEKSKLALEQANQTMALLKGQMELIGQQLQAVKLQTQQQGLPVRQLQLWVVVAQLKIAIERGTPSMPLVAQLREGWVESEPRELDALRKLAEAAEYRIPTEASLLQDFHQLRGDVTASLLQKDVGIWYRIKAALREHIRIRRLDREATPASNPSDDALQTLDEVEALLANGEVKAAIEAVNALPNGRTAFESWLSDAQRLVNARQSVQLLENALLESMQSTSLRESVFPNAEPADEEGTDTAEPAPDAATPTSPTVE